MRGDDDTTLLQGCREGDQEAWELLVRRYQRLIYTIPLRAGLSEDMAAEVFQHVCLVLLQHIHCIEQPERIGAWLATSARRETWRLLRRQRVSAAGADGGDDLSSVVDTSPLPDELLEDLERQHAVRHALGCLDERCQELLDALFYRAEPPAYAEIAARLGMPEGSIGPTRARCLRKLHRILETLGYT